MRTNFQMQDQNITMVKGDTLAFNVEVYDENNDPVTATSAYMTCKKMPTSDEFVFQKSLGDGITQENSLMTVRVAPEDTAETDAGEYYYDLQIGFDNDIFTIMRGLLSLEQNIT